MFCLKNRLKVLQENLAARSLDGAILGYSRNVLYYTGTAQPSYLAVTPADYGLFVRSGMDFAREEAFIDNDKIRPCRGVGDLRDFFRGGANLGTELDIIPMLQFQSMTAKLPGLQFSNVSPLVLEQRKRKDSLEIERLRAACAIIHKGHEAAVSSLREGMTELELAAITEDAHRRAGHEGHFFIRLPDFFMSRGPIGSGANLLKNSGVVYTITGVGLSPSMPAGPSRKKISRGEPVIIDIPVMANGYHADQTRTYVLGRAAPEIRAMYNDLKAIADHLVESMRPGLKCSDLVRLAFARAEQLGRSGQFQSFGAGRRSGMIGHGIGLELNEPPILWESEQSGFQAGQVIALDIHMLDETAGAVKLEDMVLIGEESNELITMSPRELSEI